MKEIEHDTHLEVVDVSEPAQMREHYLLYYGDKIGTFMADVAELAHRQGIGGALLAVADDNVLKMNSFSLDPRCAGMIDACAVALSDWMEQQPGASLMKKPGPAGHG